MWSGPRTVSTALMRAWENRPDTAVTDEPLYAFYLDRTGLDHPGRDAVIASQPTDWRVVLARAGQRPAARRRGDRLRQAHDPPPAARGGPGRAGPVPARAPDQGPARAARLLRQGPGRTHPGRPRPAPAGGDLRDVRRPGGRFPRPAHRARGHPARALPGARHRLRRPDAGLAGRPRDSDGVWAPWWYAGVLASTGFAPYRPPAAPLPARLEPLADRCLPYFDRLYHYRITPAGGPDAASVR